MQLTPKSATPANILTVTSTTRSRKTTCRDDKINGSKKHERSGQGRGKQPTGRTAPKVKRTQTLSESCSQLFGITPPVTRSLHTRQNPIDYVSLNDGFDDETEAPTRKKRHESHRPRSEPSATRVAAQKNSPQAKDSMNKVNASKPTALTGVPKPSIPSPEVPSTLTGVQQVTNPDVDKPTSLPDASSQSITVPVPDPSNPNPDTLPDLVNIRTIDTENTEEERDAIDDLLSLGGSGENQIDEDDNAALMPIGAPTDIVDAAPVPILLDQVNVDNAIANIINTEQNETEVPKSTEVDDDQPDDQSVNKPQDTDPSTVMNTDPSSATNTQGSLKIHTLKKKPYSNRRYKCSVCGETRPTMQQVNAHHLEKHKPQTCTVCGRTFALASSLIWHSYDHEEKRYKCSKCNFAAHFESELTAHKIVHRKIPAFQCMVKNCGKWFQRKWELTMHVKKHDSTKLKCDVCEFTTSLNKHLKEHMRKHSDDCPYVCAICNKGFRYRSGLKRYRDREHK